MTYYEILEVSENASQEVIHMAYKALCKKYHPDVFSGDKVFAEEQIKKINSAYAILSDDAKRKEYDAFLKSKTSGTRETNYNKESAGKVEKKSKNKDSTKHGIIIGVLLLSCFAQAIRPYIESSEFYDYALGLGLFDFAFINLVMLVVPLFVFAFRKTNTANSIKTLCFFNSIGVWAIALILFVCKITTMMLIGWVLAIIYYFINKHLLLMLSKINFDRKEKLIVSGGICFILLVVVICGMYCLNNINNNDDKRNEEVTTFPTFEEWSDNMHKAAFLDQHIVFVIEGFSNCYYTYDEMIYVMQEVGEYEFAAYNVDQAISLNYLAAGMNVDSKPESEKADFLDQHIVFVIEGFGDYYYTYDEMRQLTRNMDECEFWAYNTETAIAMGYRHN